MPPDIETGNRPSDNIDEHPDKNKHVITLKVAIGDLPSLDPLIYDIEYEKHLEIFPDYEKKSKTRFKGFQMSLPS